MLLLPLLPLSFAAAIEPPLAAAEVAMFGAAELLLAQQFDFYGRKIFIGVEKSLEKLLLIFFFWSLIKRVDSRKSLKLVCFSASRSAKINSFKMSLNLLTH